ERAGPRAGLRAPEPLARAARLPGAAGRAGGAPRHGQAARAEGAPFRPPRSGL
ncbi:MAG: hypothetical protein AVDCRST_MAG30-875, partial [uncultured Solirubrobacteraceae bacterium]